jgi:methylenetetrahydrofolate dehydrogenase (NADP+) / methenyltetrahydrofolate cyclohydrolase
MAILDGKQTSARLQDEIKLEVDTLRKSGKKIPQLAAVLVGNNPASEVYVNSKVKACEKVGFKSTLLQLPGDVSREKLLEAVDTLNADPEIDGYIVQLPLPEHINETEVLLRINPTKDVDGFHPENVGRMALGLPCFLPATPFGILKLLEEYKVETAGKNCLVIGRSHIVGSPMSILLSRNAYPGNATVTLAHSKTKNLKEICLNSDIIIAALGKPEFLKADMVKQGAVVVDVGISRVPDAGSKSGYRITGDVAFAEVAPKCSWITPVPGGVGPMTIAALLLNTLQAGKLK